MNPKPENVTAQAGDVPQKPLILVVDNNPINQFRTCMFLQRLDYHVFPVNTAENALIILGLAKPRIILSEITLPQMNGLDMIRKIRQDPDIRDTPVLIYTVFRDQAHRQSSLDAGAVGFISVPADPNELYAAVQKATESTPRSFVRLKTSIEVIVGQEGIPGLAVRKERITALSENGMYVSTPAPLPFGTIIPFTIYLNGASVPGIAVQGKVQYSQQGGGTVKNPGMGVTFSQISSGDKELLRNYIKAKMTEGIAVSI